MSDCNCGTVAEVLRIAFSIRCVSFENDMRCECIVIISNVLMDYSAAFSEIRENKIYIFLHEVI